MNMVEPVSTNLTSTVKLTQASTVPAAASAQPQATPVVKAGQADTIELTITARIRALQKQGQDIQEIAMQLGMDPRTIEFLMGDQA
jgi:hypothetical protein